PKRPRQRKPPLRGPPLHHEARVRRSSPRERPRRRSKFLRRVVRFLFIVLLLAGVTHETPAQKKLPSADKIVGHYLKALGGKKSVNALKDITYNWTIQFNDQPFGTAVTQRKAPSSERWELTFGNGQIISA